MTVMQLVCKDLAAASCGNQIQARGLPGSMKMITDAREVIYRTPDDDHRGLKLVILPTLKTSCALGRLLSSFMLIPSRNPPAKHTMSRAWRSCDIVFCNLATRLVWAASLAKESRVNALCHRILCLSQRSDE